MSGESAPVLDIPPGVVRNGTPYSVGRRWWDVNWVRWEQGQLTPIKGWVKGKGFGVDTSLIGDEWQGMSLDFTTDASAVRTATAAEIIPGSQPSALEIVRDAYSWVDNGKTPWYAVGTQRNLYATSPSPTNTTVRTITPAGLVWSKPPVSGYGAGLFGDGYYGKGAPTVSDSIGQWSLDNFGRYLVAVHTQDGRLFSWDPSTPTVVAQPVTNAPTGNGLVVVTEERMVMVLGGRNNPRRVKWCNREDITTWTASATNTAGGFELNSSGSIVAACPVQGGILVLTDVDAHMIEYVGAPAYYARRRLSDEVGCAGKNTLVSVTGGAFWLSKEGFWRFDGAITPVPSTVDSEVLLRGNLSNPANVFLGYNEYNREIWCFYPSTGSPSPDRYVFVSIAGEPYWSMGQLARTAWLNPIWDSKPILFNGQYEYFHETGDLAAGATRVNDIYAETGQFEIANGDRVMRVDRIWQDGWTNDPVHGFDYSEPAYALTFKLRQAPAAPERVVGPISLNNTEGYTGVRFRSRSMAMRLTPTADTPWALGKLRMRLKAGGMR
jgi:hypothetical protein